MRVGVGVRMHQIAVPMFMAVHMGVLVVMNMPVGVAVNVPVQMMIAVHDRPEICC